MNDGHGPFNIRRFAAACLAVSASFMLTCHAAAEQDNIGGGNIIENPSFETGAYEGAALPYGWFIHVYDGNPNTTVFSVGSLSHTGDHCAVIENIRFNDARIVQSVKVSDNRIYRLSCWILAENVSNEGKGANLSILDGFITSRQIKGTSDRWEYVEIYARIGKGVDRIDITLGVGGYSGESYGKAAFDDVAVEEASIIPEGAVVADLRREADQGGDIAGSGIPGNDSLMVYLILASVTLAIASLYLLKKDEDTEYAGFPGNKDGTALFGNDTEKDR